MDSSYRTQLFLQNRTSTCQRTPYALTYAYSIVTGMVCEEACLKKHALRWVLNWRAQSGDISQTDRQRIPDRWSDETVRAPIKRFQFTFWNFQKLLVSGSEYAWYVQSDAESQEGSALSK